MKKYSGDGLPTIKFYIYIYIVLIYIVVLTRSVFEDHDTLYPHIFLKECFYKL